MVDFQEDNFEQKLLSLKDTQDSIQALSLWCLKHQAHHKKVVHCWLHVLKKVKVEQRVTLFYLANDVIQYSKRKGYPFVESWATALQKATPLVRDDKVKHKILRLFKIWDERSIYDETFLADLSGLLTAHTKKSNQPSTVDLISEFQPSLLFSKIRKCKLLEEDTDLKLKIVKESNIPVSDPDALQIAVKDRRNGDDLLQDIDDGLVKLEAYTKALELEIKERIEVINVLEVSEQFYETQRGEAKVVCNAYRNFGNRIKTLKRKLDELLPTLPSPVPSPDINAPSPSSGSDIEIPEENKTVYDSEKSFIGTDFVTAMNNAASEKQFQYMRSMDQSYDLESNQSQYSVHALPNYDAYQQSGDLSLPLQEYYSNNSHNNIESPASPPEKHLSTDPYSYRPENTRNVEQGNPIEVISSGNTDTHNFSVGQFLQNLMSSNSTSTTPMPPTQSKIPGLESPTSNSREVFNFIESKVKEDNVPLWNDKPVSKYQSWPSPDISWDAAQETPVSPPAFERESYSHPVEYVDTNIEANRFANPFGTDQRAIDVDHRIMNMKPAPLMGQRFDSQISTIPLPKHDVDERLAVKTSIANHNLISLTESPSVNDSWKTNDPDFRTIPMPPSPPAIGERGASKTPQDIIESVDMEMSDEEHEDKKTETTRHRKSSVKEEGAGDPPQQLQPPPNPWDMLNIPIDNDDSSNSMKVPPPLMDFAPNGPPMARPPMDFSQFPMPPNTRPMHFGPPPMPLMRIPTGDPMFRPRMEFPRLPNMANGFNPPFNFMPDGQMMFPAGAPPNLNQTPGKEFTPPPFPNDRKFPPKHSQNINTIEPLIQNRQFEKRPADKNPPAFEEPAEFPPKPVRSNLKEISLSDVLERTMNSVSERKKQTDAETKDAKETEKKEDDKEEPEGTDNLDLFGEDVANDNAPDDGGDDLYNNIIEQPADTGAADATDQGAPEGEQKLASQSDDKVPLSRQLSSDVRFIQGNNFVVYESEEDLQNSVIANADNPNESTPKPKAPFQATVPKLPKPLMAPPNFMEECNTEERNPWPMLPVIDLSIENNSPADFEPNEIEETNQERLPHPLAFLKANGTPDFMPRFGRGINNDFRPRNMMNNSPADRRFSGQMPQTPRLMDMARPPRRFSTPRQEFRLRGNMNSNQEFRARLNMTPNQEFRPRGSSTPGQEFRQCAPGMNQDQMRRMPRPQFSRSPGASNVRGNFQNSPRMFKGGRPFRRGW